MRRDLFLAITICLCSSAPLFANSPAETVSASEQVLSDLMAIPGKQIPHRLLADAQGIAIIPNVIKIGFVAGARRGHGVVMVRDPDGEWSLPQFITLTGGSVGWQAGVQGTDVVLVFTSRKGVDGLMQGKFTVGVDASVTAGPVGREVEAGTDTTLRSEIFSYSRSRGLFAGVSLDGSALEIDHDSHIAFYGTPTGVVPRRVPGPATELRHFLAEVTPHHSPLLGIDERPTIVASPRLIESLRRSLVGRSGQLQTVLNPDWQRYLALPKELHEPGNYPTIESVANTLERFSHVNSTAEYRNLARNSDFQSTYELLREYEQALMTFRPQIKLPSPPTH